MNHYYDFSITFDYAPNSIKHKYICAKNYKEAFKRLMEYRDWISKDGTSFFNIVSGKEMKEEDLDGVAFE